MDVSGGFSCKDCRAVEREERDQEIGTFFYVKKVGKEARTIRKMGTPVEYNGKKYVSLKELSEDINIPYSPLVHRYYRTKNIEDAIEGARNSLQNKKPYVLWNRQYKNINSVASAFGLQQRIIMIHPLFLIDSNMVLI